MGKRVFILTLSILILTLSGSAQKRDKTIGIFEGRGVTNSSRIIYDATGQGLSKFPAFAADPALEILILDNNNIESIPNWIASLPNLRILSLRNNNLSQLNPVIINCKKLEQLYLSDNPNLVDLPSLGHLKNLLIVDVMNTQIHDVPATIWSLDNLFYFKYTKLSKTKK